MFSTVAGSTNFAKSATWPSATSAATCSSISIRRTWWPWTTERLSECFTRPEWEKARRSERVKKFIAQKSKVHCTYLVMTVLSF